MTVNAQIVVNADDFGRSKIYNKAILKSFVLETISTTTLMCNMEGFEEAVQMIYENKLMDRIGIHLNVTDGKPLSEKLKKLPKFVNNNGQMYKSFKGQFLNKAEQEAVYEELQAQIDKLKGQGISPSHIDTHHHFHFYIDSNKIVRELARRNKISAVRLRFNYGRMSILKKLFAIYLNRGIKLDGLAKTDYFCEIRKVDAKLLALKRPIEVMVHPVLNEQNVILNYENGKIYEELVNKYLPVRNFVTYNYLIRRY